MVLEICSVWLNVFLWAKLDSRTLPLLEGQVWFVIHIIHFVLASHSTIYYAACVGECWKEMYSFTASYSDLNLAFNFKLGNVSISRNERLEILLICLQGPHCNWFDCLISKHLAALNFYYPSFTQTVLVNHYPTIAGWLGSFESCIYCQWNFISKLFLPIRCFGRQFGTFSWRQYGHSDRIDRPRLYLLPIHPSLDTNERDLKSNNCVFFLGLDKIFYSTKIEAAK